ncbi:MAG: hypothetical protein PUK60_01940 [Bacteroidales bacterium]|nr:hypothetical protein [Bacteroidales bacterium]
MIIPNGILQAKAISKPGGRDEYGYPIPAEASWSDPIRCQVVPVSVDLQARTGGGSAFTDATYTVLLDYVDRETVTGSEVVKITALDGLIKEQEFFVIKCIPLVAVRQIELLV